MLQFLKHLSGFFFYILGASFFVGWVMIRNQIWTMQWTVWMQVADLPLAFSALVYGGLSLYLSLRNPERPSKVLMMMIGVPLTLFFGLILAMNFWS